jgi:hypothetical protein
MRSKPYVRADAPGRLRKFVKAQCTAYVAWMASAGIVRRLVPGSARRPPTPILIPFEMAMPMAAMSVSALNGFAPGRMLGV